MPAAPSAPDTRPAVLPLLSTKGVAPMNALTARLNVTKAQLRRWLTKWRRRNSSSAMLPPM
eukprot:CAMPEP_0202916770 /NCGR_PEP_ID=MMETSP1392-20130828/69374_1 /ASSEMBLY_ACC=CAM_ASM_000868 /TAXON_ID=225041 /ORGANISM="Chlamydomonas chlamydogama, Strain SAG 11-48b" /LENGTH=60 /DNA_ID=CAMNT_0049609305 /DNA_START=918 /DNA_END=1100 /DNA_ORIENTATION=-